MKNIKTATKSSKKETSVKNTKTTLRAKKQVAKKASPIKKAKSVSKVVQAPKGKGKSLAKSTNTKSSLKKNSSIASIDDYKSNPDCEQTIHCNLCKKPFEIKASEKSWRMLCTACFLKVKGKLSKCDNCNIEFLALPGRENNTCYDCNIGLHEGIKHNCVKCKKSFFTKKNATQKKSKCYECYLKEVGVETKCTTCSAVIHVKPEDMSWKKKCYSCFIHNN